MRTQVAIIGAGPSGLLLGQLAWLTVVRAAGEPKERMAAGPRFALTLAALGRNEEAAGALDLASVDAENDPAQDARATVLWVQERLLRALGRAVMHGEAPAGEIAAPSPSSLCSVPPSIVPVYR